MLTAYVISLALSFALGAEVGRPIAALDAVVEDGALIYVAADGRSVRATELASGAQRWQAALQGAFFRWRKRSVAGT
jgi:hypothetical protein